MTVVSSTVVHYVEHVIYKGDSILIKGCGAQGHVLRRSGDKSKVTCVACLRGIKKSNG
jgi:hypothetical protein